VTRKFTLDWKTGADVRSYVQGLYAPGLRKILDEHYFNHPIASFVRKAGTGIGAADSTAGGDEMKEQKKKAVSSLAAFLEGEEMLEEIRAARF
jgi:hypothetical protein